MLFIASKLALNKHNKCNCGDDSCKRDVIGKNNGRLSVVNHFTCDNVKNFITKYNNLELLKDNQSTNNNKIFSETGIKYNEEYKRDKTRSASCYIELDQNDYKLANKMIEKIMTNIQLDYVVTELDKYANEISDNKKHTFFIHLNNLFLNVMLNELDKYDKNGKIKTIIGRRFSNQF